MRPLTKVELETILDYIDASKEPGSHYSGMTYEEGMMYIIDLMRDLVTLEDLAP